MARRISTGGPSPWKTWLVKTDDPQTFIDSIDKKWDGTLPFTVIYDRQGVLSQRLEGNLRDVDVRGAVVKRDIEERTQRLIAAQAILTARAAELTAEERIRERMRVFHNLMNEGRAEEAQRQALAIQQVKRQAQHHNPPRAQNWNEHDTNPQQMADMMTHLHQNQPDMVNELVGNIAGGNPVMKAALGGIAAMAMKQMMG